MEVCSWIPATVRFDLKADSFVDELIVIYDPDSVEPLERSLSWAPWRSHDPFWARRWKSRSLLYASAEPFTPSSERNFSRGPHRKPQRPFERTVFYDARECFCHAWVWKPQNYTAWLYVSLSRSWYHFCVSKNDLTLFSFRPYLASLHCWTLVRWAIDWSLGCLKRIALNFRHTRRGFEQPVIHTIPEYSESPAEGGAEKGTAALWAIWIAET